MLGLLAIVAALSLPVGSADPGDSSSRRELIGRSSAGRPLWAIERRTEAAARPILVVGCIHGTECAGRAITRELRRVRLPARTHLWIVDNVNPDGFAAGVRQNGRGVDLNRNFPAHWRPIGRRWDPQYSGPRPLSEPETRAARRLIRRVRPRVTIWFHQPLSFVRAWGGSVPAARKFARASGLPFKHLRWLAGTAPSWQNRRFPGTASFVVELPSGELRPREARRYARAALALARGTS